MDLWGAYAGAKQNPSETWVCGAYTGAKQNPNGTWACGGAYADAKQNPDGTWVCDGAYAGAKQNPNGTLICGEHTPALDRIRIVLRFLAVYFNKTVNRRKCKPCNSLTAIKILLTISAVCLLGLSFTRTVQIAVVFLLLIRLSNRCGRLIR